MYISKVAEIDLSIHIHMYFIVNLMKTYFIGEVFILGYHIMKLYLNLM